MWSPSCWDSRLPADLYAEAKVIGGRLYDRLSKEWSEDKINSFFEEDESGCSFYLERKEVFRILVAAFMDELPKTDPDIVAYNNLHAEVEAKYEAEVARRNAEARNKMNRRAHERAKKARRMRWLARCGQPTTVLPGIQTV
jgi:hypothetical protein